MKGIDDMASQEGIDPIESKVFHRFLNAIYPNIDKGVGVRLWTNEGREFLDACSGGAMVATLGHGVSEIIEAAEKQALSVPYIYNEHFSNEPRERLASRLIEDVAPQMARVRFTSTGSEANEMALRLVRKFHADRGSKSRTKMITQAQSYHGSTMATLALTGRPKSLQEPFLPYLTQHYHIPPSTKRFDPTGKAALAKLDEIIEEAGAENIAGFVCEPVSASALPGHSPPTAFWEGLATRKEEYGFLVWFDEIVTGIGRTGRWLAADNLPIQPDVVTLGKGLGAGYAPISAVLCTERVYDAIAEGSGDFELGHTWDGAPLSCAVGMKVLDIMEDDHLVDTVKEKGPQVLKWLKSAVGKYDSVGEVRGQGYLLGLELVDPRDGKAILPAEMDIASKIEGAALASGVLIATSHPNADGFASDQVLLAPSYTSTEEEISEMIGRLARAIKVVDKDLKAALKKRK